MTDEESAHVPQQRWYDDIDDTPSWCHDPEAELAASGLHDTEDR